MSVKKGRTATKKYGVEPILLLKGTGRALANKRAHANVLQ